MTLCNGCIGAQRSGTVTGILHKSYDSLIDCIGRCDFCTFLCDLVGQEVLTAFQSQALFSNYHCHIRLEQDHDINLNLAIILEFEDDSRRKLNQQLSGYSGIQKLTVCGKTSPAFLRPFWSSTKPIAIGDRIPTVLEWIRECKEKHSACVTPESPASSRPARFIDISGLNSGKSIRLISTQVISQDEKIAYVALTHCWGGVVPLRTMRDNLNAHMEEIPYQSLPRTFKNVITIAQAMKVLYVWIDSICIVQDDSEDWQTEAAKMHKIYRGAKLTISATSASHPNDGPDLSVSLPVARQFYVTEKGQPRKRAISVRHPVLPNLYDAFQQQTIHKRGWIFQERMLSPRILHIMQDELVWQCHALMDSESGRCRTEGLSESNADELWEPVRDVFRLPLQLGADDVYRAERLWWTWVESYIDRSLTYPRDIFPAFAGMVSQFQELTGDEPALGLWRKQLPLHLSWQPDFSLDPMTDIEAITKVPPEELALTQSLPSWTWMSLPMSQIRPRTNYEMWTRFNPHEIFHEVEVQDVQITWSGHAWSSLPTKGVLKLRGRLVQVAQTDVQVDSNPGAWEPGAYMVENKSLRGGISLDNPEGRIKGKRENVVALSLWSYRKRYHYTWNFLVLEPTGGDHEYRRIGTASFQTPEEHPMMPSTWAYKYKDHQGPAFDEIGSMETITVV